MTDPSPPYARPAGRWRWRSHRVTVGLGLDPRDGMHTVCSCGWAADPTVPHAWQWADARDHLDEARDRWRARMAAPQ